MLLFRHLFHHKIVINELHEQWHMQNTLRALTREIEVTGFQFRRTFFIAFIFNEHANVVNKVVNI